jgi:TatD DNase family protein
LAIIDTHTHLYLSSFDPDREIVLDRAREAGVEKFYLPAIDSETFPALLELERRYPQFCFAMTGLHPCSVKENYRDELDFVQQNLLARKFAAIGEIGLDFYWDKNFEKEQYLAFEQQMEWAILYKLPISIHTRNAMGETIEAVKPFSRKGLKGIFHCFSGSLETAREIIKMGFLLGIGGVVTYKNAGLAAVLEKTDLSCIVLETDAPFLAPAPFRGKRNEPAYLSYIINKIAEIKNISKEEVEAHTTKNAALIFNTSKPGS